MSYVCVTTQYDDNSFTTQRTPNIVRGNSHLPGLTMIEKKVIMKCGEAGLGLQAFRGYRLHFRNSTLTKRQASIGWSTVFAEKVSSLGRRLHVVSANACSVAIVRANSSRIQLLDKLRAIHTDRIRYPPYCRSSSRDRCHGTTTCSDYSHALTRVAIGAVRATIDVGFTADLGVAVAGY